MKDEICKSEGVKQTNRDEIIIKAYHIYLYKCHNETPLYYYHTTVKKKRKTTKEWPISWELFEVCSYNLSGVGLRIDIFLF